MSKAKKEGQQVSTDRRLMKMGGSLVVRNAVIQSTGLPVITLEVDMVDSRLFNEQQANLVLDALMESMARPKK